MERKSHTWHCQFVVRVNPVLNVYRIYILSHIFVCDLSKPHTRQYVYIYNYIYDTCTVCMIIPIINKYIYIYNIHPPWVKNRQATGFTLAVAVTQLLIYNGMGGTHGGPGEKIAHCFEFTFAPWRNSLESHWLWLTVRHGIHGPNRNRWFTY